MVAALSVRTLIASRSVVKSSDDAPVMPGLRFCDDALACRVIATRDAGIFAMRLQHPLDMAIMATAEITRILDTFIKNCGGCGNFATQQENFAYTMIRKRRTAKRAGATMAPALRELYYR